MCNNEVSNTFLNSQIKLFKKINYTLNYFMRLISIKNFISLLNDCVCLMFQEDEQVQSEST